MEEKHGLNADGVFSFVNNPTKDAPHHEAVRLLRSFVKPEDASAFKEELLDKKKESRKRCSCRSNKQTMAST